MSAPMRVQRIAVEHGGRVWPPLDATWSELDQLRWHAAVETLDSGVDVAVREKAVGKRIGLIVTRPATYEVRCLGSVVGDFTFDHARSVLIGFGVGARAARRR